MKSRWLPIGLFAAVTVFLFRAFIFSDAMLVGQDTFGLGYTARAFFADALSRGNFPGWNPHILGGTPFLASLAGGDSLYPFSAPLLLFMETYRALGWKLVLHVFLAGVGMYGWTRALGVGRWAATVAGLGYLVAPYLVTLVYPAHDGKLFVTALTPFLFWAVHRFFVNRSPLAWAGVGAVVGLATLTTHFQMAYFLFLAVGAYGVFLAVQQLRAPVEDGGGMGRAGTTFALFLLASVVGVSAAGVQFLPALDYISSDSRRTATTTQAGPEENKAYAASWSMHPEEGLSLILPEFVGSTSRGSEWTTGTYWGRNPIKYNHEYIGLVLLMLAAVGFTTVAARRSRWFFLGMGAIAFLYALGASTPVWHLAYAVLPGVSLFRAAGMAIFLTGFAVTTLAAFGVERLIQHAQGTLGEGVDLGPAAARDTRILILGAGAIGLLFLLAASGALTGIWTSVLYSDITADRQAALGVAETFIVRGALVALILAGATAGLGWAATQRKLSAPVIFAGLALLVTVDGARIDAPFIQTEDFEPFGDPTPMETLIADKVDAETPFRLLDMRGGGGEVRGSMFGIDLTWGHHPNDLGRYRELIGAAGGSLPLNLILSPNLLRLTNTRYVLWPSAQFGPAEQFLPFEGFPEGGMRSLQGATIETASQFADGRIYETLYRVDDLARARLVAEVQVVPDAQAVQTLGDPAFPLDRAVTAATDLGVELGGGAPEGQVEWVEDKVDARTLQVTTDRPALLVISENWYPGWKAAVDGTETEVHRVNLTQQAVAVPAGAHRVEITFSDDNVRTGLILTLIGSVLLFSAFVVGLMGRWQGRESERLDPSRSGDNA